MGEMRHRNFYSENLENQGNKGDWCRSKYRIEGKNEGGRVAM